MATTLTVNHQPSTVNHSLKHDPYSAFRIADFRRYIFAWVTSQIGFEIQSVAIAWEVYERTGSARAIGITGGVQALPVILLALPAGQMADMFDRRKLVFISRILAAACSIGLALSSYYQAPINLMYCLLLMASISGTIGRPAQSSLMPQLVPAEIFSNAATWSSSTWQFAGVVGPALGGLVLIYSIQAAYVIAAAGSIYFAVSVLTLNPQETDRKKEPVTMKTLLAGCRFVWDKRVLFTIISLDLFAVLLGGATYLLPIFAKDILHVGGIGFGLLRAAPAVGAFAMAIGIAHLPPFRKAGVAMLWAVAGFGVATIVFGISRSFTLSLVMLFLAGALDNVSVVVRHTLIQLLTPDEMRGRVSAVNSVFISSSNQIGGLESGETAEWWGPVTAVVVGGVGTIVVVIVTAVLSPQLLKIGSLEEVHKEEGPVEEEEEDCEL
jgi:MFS family permease